jgi:mannose-6-phosphate isomerase
MNNLDKYQERPWGNYSILFESEFCKVKIISVNPSQRLSYQFHDKRSEAWTIVSGTGKITLDGKAEIYKEGETILIPVGVKHRVENISDSDLIFIEVQTGTYFGEDDITRIKDDYGRK